MVLTSVVLVVLGAAALAWASPVPDKILDDKLEKYSVRSWFGGGVSHGHRKPGKQYPGYGGYEGRPQWGSGAASSASASASAASAAGGGGPGHGGGSHSNANAHSNSHSATLGAGPFYGSLSSSHAGASASSGAGSFHRRPKPYSHEYYDY